MDGQHADPSGAEHRAAIRDAVAALCAQFPDTYWSEQDQLRRYPIEFVEAMTAGGWLGILIPPKYGGDGADLADAAAVLEAVHCSGGNAGPIHAQMYTMGTILRHGSEDQKQRYLPSLADGSLRLQSMAVTEPDAGSDTTRIVTSAARTDGGYLISGRKVFISRTEHTDLMLVLARTTPLHKAPRRTAGMTLLLLDLRREHAKVSIRPISMMINHHTTEVVFEGAFVPDEDVIGDVGGGFAYLLSGLNAERILIASEALGDARYFLNRATEYARDRHVFDRAIGANQGIAFPLAAAHMRREAASLMRDSAAQRFDAGEESGSEANMAKWLASEAAWEAANVAMTVFGGYGLATEYAIERKFREARLHLVAPVSNNMVLSHVATRVLGLPRSY